MTSEALRRQTEGIQRAVSDPRTSAWVHANAGSGKTYVLAQRVIRLLLAGVDPTRILCLTFTKAAAANMSLRVFAILSRWTACDDEKLAAEIEKTGFSGKIDLADARRLFARAVETPGGLKIQTIHAFCERILHLFPFEANAPARFEALDDARQTLLMSEAREHTLQAAIAEENSQLGTALRRVAAEASGDAFSRLLREALTKRETIANAAALQSGEFARRLSARLGAASDEGEDEIVARLLEGGPSPEQWREAAAALKAGGARDAALGAACEKFLNAAATDEKIAACKLLFFTAAGDERKGASLVTKGASETVKSLFAGERTRAVELFARLNVARAVGRSVALHRLADAVLSEYRRLKNMRGLLDFDDLIDRTATLLQRSDSAWVLYKLDQGIDHVLVDEAQDTSPRQWAILKSLVADFFSGASARNAVRTVFAVGDEKQSIFSFQGADPQQFELSKRHFAKAAEAVGQRFLDAKLQVSFRSTPPVLQSVDTVFSIEANFAGLSMERIRPDPHQAWKNDLPGLVEIWPAAAPQDKPDPEPWTMPLDALSEHSPAAALAQRIADCIKTLTARNSHDAVHEADGRRRRIQPGDIMILVRRRNAFFDAIIRALKRAGVPVAGADRLKLMDHIAVKDLVAAGHAALLPQDDFTLACLLKTPLFGFDDDDLLRLAPHRKASLFAELFESGTQRDREAARRIARWGTMARTLGPYRFYAQILSAQRGRRAMLERLGPEAGDAMDEFLRLALQWERENASSLSAFLHSMQGADVEVKRDMEAAGDAVRVMTVHASKGLEAKIVFLPDTCSTPSRRHDPALVEFALADGAPVPVWRQGKKSDPPAVEAELERLREAGDEEYRRLLYVAMTRAEERLYICGYHGKREPEEGCWLRMIENALAPVAVPAAAPWGEVRRIGEAARIGQADEDTGREDAASPPAWLFAPAQQEQAPAPPLRPSQALAAADQLDAEAAPVSAPQRSFALLEGELTHALLQHLPSMPEAERAATAERFLNLRGAALEPIRREAIARNVFATLAHPACSGLFGPQSRAEAAIAGRALLPGGREVEISGRIDRLAVAADEVLIADFKSGRPPPGAAPAPYVAQLALYRAALARLFPGRPVRAFLVWTASATVIELDAQAMDAALASLAAANKSP